MDESSPPAEEGRKKQKMSTQNVDASDDEETKAGGGEEEFEEDEEDEDEDEIQSAQHFIDEEISKVSNLLTKLKEEELSRFEMARRSSLNSKEVARTMELVSGMQGNMDEKVVLAMSTLVKLYLAELIETARSVAGKDFERGGRRIQPKDLREAYRKMKTLGRTPPSL